MEQTPEHGNAGKAGAGSVIVNTSTSTLSQQLQALDTNYRGQFDTNGWATFELSIADYTNDLCNEALRESQSKAEKLGQLTTGSDVERASARLDQSRNVRREVNSFGFQVAGVAGSVLSGVCANWAFADIKTNERTPLPWIALLCVAVATIVVMAVGFWRKVEP